MNNSKSLPLKAFKVLVDLAIAEDIGSGDITSDTVTLKDEKFVGAFVSRENGVLAGTAIAKYVLKRVCPKAKIKLLLKDGATLKPGSKIAQVTGSANGILKAERIMLNFLQRLSGIATITNIYVNAVKNTKCKILDTRKTTPGWRIIEKYAVTCGGGFNHRIGLYDMILIKDNHIASLKKISKKPVVDAILRAQKIHKGTKTIIVEVDNLNQLKDALPLKPDVILLDNMTNAELKNAVNLRNKLKSKTLLEASGGVNLKTVKKIANTGVDRISIGALTHSVKALDIGLDS